MPDEKSIERYMCGVKKVDGYSQPYMSPSVQGDWVRVSDHLDALGEVEKNLRAEEQHRLEVQRACIAANQKLETLRSGLEAEVERLRTDARRATDTASAHRGHEEHAAAEYRMGQANGLVAASRLLIQLLDALGDTEKQADLHSRSVITLVAGHLEGYADAIEKFGFPGPSQPTQGQLAKALREDAERLKQSGGGEDRG